MRWCGVKRSVVHYWLKWLQSRQEVHGVYCARRARPHCSGHLKKVWKAGCEEDDTDEERARRARRIEQNAPGGRGVGAPRRYCDLPRKKARRQ